MVIRLLGTIAIVLLAQVPFHGLKAQMRVRDTAALVTLYQTHDGLPQSDVTCIFRDSHSIMWFGTRGGLARYDGEQFIPLRHNPMDSTSIGSNDIRSIREDRQGNLWIATGHGVSHFMRESLVFKNYAIQGNGRPLFNRQGAESVHVDRRGNVWVITDASLELVDTLSGRVREYPFPAGRSYLPACTKHVIGEDAQGRLWIVIRGELLLFSMQDLAFVSDEELTVLLAGASYSNVSGLAFSSNGALWISQQGNLYGYPELGMAPTVYPIPLGEPGTNPYEVGSVFTDANGMPWCRVASGLVRLDPEKQVWTKVSSFWEKGKKIGPILFEAFDFTDRNVFWFSASNGAVCWRQAGPFIEQYSYRIYGAPMFASLDVRAIYSADDRRIWVGTCGGGLSYLDRQTGAVIPASRRTRDGALLLDTIYSLLKVPNDALHAVAPMGIARYDSVSDSWWSATHGAGTEGTSIPRGWGQFHCAVLLPNGKIALGGERGLCIYDPITRQNHCTPRFDELNVTALAAGNDNLLYVGTGSKLEVFDLQSGNSTELPLTTADSALMHADGLRICTLRTTSTGQLYVGTNNGIYVSQGRGGEFVRLPSNASFVGQNVAALLDDEVGNVWSTSDRWVGEFSRTDESFHTYGVADAIDVGEFNANAAFRSSQGRLYFGGKSGMVRLDTRILDQRYSVAPVILSQCLLEGRATQRMAPVLAGRQVEVPSEFNSITLVFSMLDYAAPGTARYQYMVEGIAEDWRDVLGGNTLTITNLPRGNSRIRYRASNREGIWEEGEPYTLIIHGSPWTSWIAILAYSLVGVAALVALYLAFRKRHAKAAVATPSERPTATAEVTSATHEDATHAQEGLMLAARTQQALLPSAERVAAICPDSFVIHAPQNIVGGDFYWVSQAGPYVYLAVADCTGHGMEGFHLSMVALTLLRSAILEQRERSASHILSTLNDGLIQAQSSGNAGISFSEGLDISVCVIDTEGQVVDFAGAFQRLVHVTPNGMTIYKGEAVFTGASPRTSYSSHRVHYELDDMLYLFSDGYADQFGGERGEKFQFARFCGLLEEISTQPCEQQKATLLERLRKWQGNQTQVDDITVLGVRCLFTKERAPQRSGNVALADHHQMA